MSLSRKKLSNQQLTERLFFHDIINHTHGLLLFLSNKKATGRGIESHEISALEKEIKTLQLMLKDHYRFNHKNLEDSSEWLPLKEIKPALSGLLDTYLGKDQIAYTITYRQEKDTQLIYLPVFYRIMNNLIKNMSEAKARDVIIDLVFDEASLLIETKNRVDHKSEWKARSIESLGLESIRLLALEHGGNFSHEIMNEIWCNHVILPLKEADIQLKNWQNKRSA